MKGPTRYVIRRKVQIKTYVEYWSEAHSTWVQFSAATLYTIEDIIKHPPIQDEYVQLEIDPFPEAFVGKP